MHDLFKDEPSNVAVTVRWVNPIGISTYDASMAQLLHSIKHPDTTVEVVSFDMSPSPTNLEYRTYESLIHERTVAMARDAEQSGVDAMIIGCFYDPALEAAREISGGMVVVAPCGACLQVASNLSNRFSIIVGREKWIEQMTERVRYYGMESRLASMRPLGLGVDDFQRDPEVTRRRIIEEARCAVEEDRAEAIILGCTIEYGFFQEVQDAVGVPVIDAVIASFKQAEHMAQMKRQFNWKPSRVWSCEPPPEEQLKEFGLFLGPAPIGNRIVT
ncbi:aspartate/glutamate racemase family protein [Massilia timonae]|uniref:Hydantoin racemase n=1 Tax=Massilia timonae CCUG 45783 TaxID=883126 RepID=K9DH89_9BURK|nr:aspartate/glutamate racemase family protein [Massilia timonae]EKU83613.1 hypothetical protein HMPREF9710_01098 [Massilia timonae CCUG 45783]